MRGSQPRGRIGVRAGAATLAALAALACEPAVGGAAQTIITSPGPLTSIYINDDLGCQVQAAGDTAPSFFGGTNPGGCGTFLALTSGENVAEHIHLFGPPVGPPAGKDFTPEQPSQTLTGSGTGADPFVLTTRVTAQEPLPSGGEAAVVGLAETDVYITGQDSYQTSLAIANLSGSVGLTGAIYHAGDCYLRNQDTGYGTSNFPAPGSVACTINAANEPASGVMAFTPNTTIGGGISGSHFFETRYSEVWSSVKEDAAQFADTAASAILQDNGMGLSWSLALGPNGTAGLSYTTTVSPSGVLTNPCTALGPPSVTVTGEQGKTTYLVGEPASVTVAAAGLGLTSNPTATHVPISTATPGTFSVTRSATGTCGTTSASFTYTVARRTLAALPPPVLGKTVNVEPVSGQVFIKLPAGAKTSLAGPLRRATESLSKGVGFIPLSEARQIPVGSILDGSAGVARIATATATAGKQQQGDFGAGIFKLLQARKQRGLTELDIIDKYTPRQLCASRGKGHGGKARGKGRTARSHPSSKVLGRLKADSHGHFTGRGQYSSATVRGTVWGVQNRCDGTLTRVTRGTVDVRDFRRHKTITLVTGQSYLAKAPGH